MKRDTLRKFEELNELVKSEIEGIVNELMESNETFEDCINEITDFYESDYKLDDYVYYRIHEKMTKKATK